MAKLILKEVGDVGQYALGEDVTLIKSNVNDLGDMLLSFQQFLICCGYHIDGHLEVVEEDDDKNEV